MIHVVRSKITKSLEIVNLCGNGKVYWIEYGRPDGKNPVNQSKSLKYLVRKFDQIV
jgi:hypothetical protein